MKRITHKLFVALSVMAPYAAIAQIATIPIETDEVASAKKQQITQEQFATIPTLEGGVTASIGALYLVPSSSDSNYFFSKPTANDISVLNIDPGYQWGFDAALGYIFENSSNSIELLLRDINTSDTAAENNISQTPNEPLDANSDLSYELHALDLMLGQFIDVGSEVQMRLAAGISYAELKRNQETFVSTPVELLENSEFKGLGPRIGIDTRYDLPRGFGITGSGSLAYYLGKSTYNFSLEEALEINDAQDNHGVMNFRGNLGVDYVYFFENEAQSTLGLELGYLIDFYDDGISNVSALFIANPGETEINSTTALSFSGPYLNLKGVF